MDLPNYLLFSVRKAFLMGFRLKNHLYVSRQYTKVLVCFFLLYLFNGIDKATGQSAGIQWQQSFGGTGNDEASAIELTSDGGCIVAGYSASTNGDITSNNGGKDFWIIKLDSNGPLEWEQS